MLLRARILDLARRLERLGARSPEERAERRELEAELDEAILSAGAHPASVDVDRAIFNILASEPERAFSADVIVEEVSDAVEFAVAQRLETLAKRGEIISAPDGGYQSSERDRPRRTA